MQAEDVRADGPLRELVVQAFENITGLASQIDEEYLQRLFNFFRLMYPVLDEAKKNPPSNASQHMRELLQNIVDEDETSMTGGHEDDYEGHKSYDKDDDCTPENDSHDEVEHGDSDNEDGDEDEMETKR